MSGGHEDGEDRHTSHDPESLRRHSPRKVRLHTLQRRLDAFQTRGEIPRPSADLFPELLNLFFDDNHPLKRLGERSELLRLLLLNAPRKVTQLLVERVRTRR
jgi:hypothetical protein